MLTGKETSLLTLLKMTREQLRTIRRILRRIGGHNGSLHVSQTNTTDGQIVMMIVDKINSDH